MKISLIWLLTFICIRKKCLERLKKIVLCKSQGTKMEGRNAMSGSLGTFRALNTCTQPVRFSVKSHLWWGWLRTHGLLGICDIQKWVFAALPTVPFMLQLDCLSFLLQLPRKVCWSHSSCLCPWCHPWHKAWGEPCSQPSPLISHVPVKYKRSLSKWTP